MNQSPQDFNTNERTNEVKEPILNGLLTRQNCTNETDDTFMLYSTIDEDCLVSFLPPCLKFLF